MTLGNIGEDQHICSMYTYPSADAKDSYSDMTLKCQYGSMSQVLGFGIAKAGASHCETDDLTDLSYLDDECQGDNLF